MKLLTMLLFVSLLAACATKPAKPENVRKAPPERLYNQALFKPSDERTVPVTFSRDPGLRGAIALSFIKVNGDYLVWLLAGEEITVFMAEGFYVFGVQNPLCEENAPACNRTIDVNLASSMDNRFRVSARDGFHISRVAP